MAMPFIPFLNSLINDEEGRPKPKRCIDCSAREERGPERTFEMVPIEKELLIAGIPISA